MTQLSQIKQIEQLLKTDAKFTKLIFKFNIKKLYFLKAFVNYLTSNNIPHTRIRNKITVQDKNFHAYTQIETLNYKDSQIIYDSVVYLTEQQPTMEQTHENNI